VQFAGWVSEHAACSRNAQHAKDWLGHGLLRRAITINAHDAAAGNIRNGRTNAARGTKKVVLPVPTCDARGRAELPTRQMR
jgi:hypothetical protein